MYYDVLVHVITLLIDFFSGKHRFGFAGSSARRPVGPPSPSLLALRLREGVHPLVQLQLCSTVIVLIGGEKHLVMMSS
jgi:hypothetical protein